MDRILETHSSSTKIFTRKPDYLVSPDSNTRNEIDYICINNRWGSSLSDVRVYSWCRCEYRPLVGKIRLKLKRSAKKKPSRLYAVAKLKDPQIFCMQIRDGALKPFYSTLRRPVHRREIGTLQRQCEGPWPVQKLLLDEKEAQTESAGYQTEPGTLLMTGRRQRREKIRHLQEQEHRLKLSTIENT